MIALLDLIYLLKNAPESLHWDLIVGWLHGSITALYLALLLTYLRKYQLVDISPEIPAQLCAGHNRLIGLNIKLLHIILDYHVVEGKDFSPHCTEEDFGHVCRTLLSSGSPIHHRLIAGRSWQPSNRHGRRIRK
jgi:hypothetical protein